jgi:hypothetical protein
VRESAAADVDLPGDSMLTCFAPWPTRAEARLIASLVGGVVRDILRGTGAAAHPAAAALAPAQPVPAA